MGTEASVPLSNFWERTCSILPMIFNENDDLPLLLHRAEPFRNRRSKAIWMRMPDEQDSELLKRFVLGEEAAFEALFKQFEHEVYRWIAADRSRSGYGGRRVG